MLYLVPTPLGNLEDVTERSLKVLRQVKTVLCEDTRRTRVLLSHFGIHVQTLRYNEHNARDLDRMMERLRAGEDLALVSDSGTPVISDPGLALVARARAENIPVQSLPGATAITTALAGSGLPGDSFVFLGFLPRSDSKQVRALQAAAALEKTIIVYESPMRIMNLIDNAKNVFGGAARAAAVRELTKVYEQWWTGSLEEIENKMKSQTQLKGEFVFLIHPEKPSHAQSQSHLA